MRADILTKGEVLKWSERYVSEHPWWDKKERELRNRLRTTKELSKTDLFEVIKWKFKDFEGRRTRITKFARRTDEFVLRKVSRLVLDLDKRYDEYKLDLFCVFDGIGVAVASAILTFYDPVNYGVFDIHVWRELFGEEPKNLHTTKNCLRLLTELRRIGAEYDLPARTVEKAYFKKNYDKEKK